MTDREKAIVMAYTGVTMLSGEKFQIFHKYIEDILGRPVWTHELADKLVWKEIEKKSKDDFIEICKTEERPQGEWVSVKDRLPDKDGDYIVTTEMFLPVNNFIREVEVTEYNIVSGFCCETHATKVIAWQELILPNPYKEAENE